MAAVAVGVSTEVATPAGAVVADTVEEEEAGAAPAITKERMVRAAAGVVAEGAVAVAHDAGAGRWIAL